MLLARGGNPDLRDEDGKTALDKVRREESIGDHHHLIVRLVSVTRRITSQWQLFSRLPLCI